MSVAEAFEEFAQERLVLNFTVASENFDFDIPVGKEFNFPAFTRNCDFDHDSVVAHGTEIESDLLLFQLRDESEEIEFGFVHRVAKIALRCGSSVYDKLGFWNNGSFFDSTLIIPALASLKRCSCYAANYSSRRQIASRSSSVRARL